MGLSTNNNLVLKIMPEELLGIKKRNPVKRNGLNAQ